MGLVLVFFALTRTEVGREGLRIEIERQFSRSLNGTLEIGELKGNLARRVQASGVVVRDASGRTVLSIDTVVVHPTLHDLFRRTVSTGRVSLVRPELFLVREDDGSWNAASLFQGTTSEESGDSWSLHAAYVSIIDGRVVTRAAGGPPQVVADGLLFDYSDSEAVGLNGRISVDWQPDFRLVDVLQLTGTLPTLDLELDSLRGQFVLRDDHLSLNALHVRIGGTSLRVSGSLDSLQYLWTGATVVDVDLRPSVVNLSELHRIVPGLVLRDVLTAEARVRGPLSGLVVEELELRRGNSRFALEGTLLGLPDSLDFDVALRPGEIRWEDLIAVWPNPPVASFDHLREIAFSGTTNGVLRFKDRGQRPLFQSTGRIQLVTDAGGVDADAVFALGGNSEAALEGSVRIAHVDPGRLLQNPGLSGDLNGELTLSVSGSSLMRSAGDLSLVLSRSRLTDRVVDSLRIDLSGEDGRLTGLVAAAEGGGRLLAHMDLDLTAAEASYHFDGMMASFDLGPVLRNDALESSLNAHFSITGGGNAWHAFEGDVVVAFDSSRMAYADTERIIAPHESRLNIRQVGSRTPRIELSGDVLELNVTGDVAVGPFITLARYWGGLIEQAVDEERSKRLRGVPAPYPAASGEEHPHSFVAMQLESTGLASQQIDAYLSVRRADVLSALLPMLPELRTNVDGHVKIRFDERRFAVDTELQADSIRLGTTDARGLTLRLRAEGSDYDVLKNTLFVDAVASGQNVRIGGQYFIQPDLAASYRPGGLDMMFSAQAPGAAQQLRLDSRLDLLHDRNRLTFRELQLSARDQTWVGAGPNVVDVYEDAVVVPGMRIERRWEGEDSDEHVYLEGTLSSAPEDTLFVDVHNILLEQATELLGVRQPFAGPIDGRIAFTGFLHQPELTGSLEIAPFALEDRVVGRLSVASRYIPGSPDVALDVHIDSLNVPLDPSDRRRVEDVRLDVAGTFRLPGLGGVEGDRGALDLVVDVERASAFFFEYIFTREIADVSGSFSGTGSVRGNFSQPIFDASLTLSDGRFLVPDFNLRYAASGDVGVDADGIHLGRLAITDATGGRAIVSGSIFFNQYRYFSFNLAGRLEELRVMNVSQSRELPFYGRIWASGDVTLTGPLSSAMLRSSNIVTNPRSDLYIPLTESMDETDAGFIVFADSTGQIPDLFRLTHRESLLADRPAGERPFLDGIDVDLNISAPAGSTVRLVIDPLLGDVINAVGSGRIQLLRTEGEFFTYGTFDVASGDYLFTAGEVFFRRFLIDEGTIVWDGDPLNASLDITASYRTRASTAGLGVSGESARLIRLIIRLEVTGRVAAPSVDLSLALDQNDPLPTGLEAVLNQTDLSAQYATSVLLTNSFMLTTSAESPLSTRGQLAFNSLSQLVASQLNRYLSYALPNVDLSFGVQGESAQNLDVTYGVALRLLDERLIIRGQGLYEQSDQAQRQQGVLDEFVVEVRLSPTVSVEVFYRREGDLLSDNSLNMNTTGAGLTYQTQFSTWRRLFERMFGWLRSNDPEDPAEEEVVAGAGS